MVASTSTTDEPQWELRSPADLGLDERGLSRALAYARTHETPGTQQMGTYMARILHGQSHADIVGPLKDAGGTNTWHHLLQQTSQWDGTLWEKPYWCDPASDQPLDTPIAPPGAAWAYNDVRVNLLSLALLRLWRRPLPEVLRDELMHRIGGSRTWSWHGYRNSDVAIAGRRMQSVSGGGHWGGGLWASTRDLARFGELWLRRGSWREQQILSHRWIDMATTPCALNPRYGYLWWLDPSGAGYQARGGGAHVVRIDPAHDLVLVARWVEDVERLVALTDQAVRR